MVSYCRQIARANRQWVKEENSCQEKNVEHGTWYTHSSFLVPTTQQHNLHLSVIFLARKLGISKIKNDIDRWVLPTWLGKIGPSSPPILRMKSIPNSMITTCLMHIFNNYDFWRYSSLFPWFKSKIYFTAYQLYFVAHAIVISCE